MKPLVVITGASSGFGEAMAQQFSESGYPLLLLARRVEKLEVLNLPNSLCRKVDVADQKAFEAAIREAENLYGKTDLLINNAGVMLLGTIDTQDPKEWQTMLNTNVMGVLNGMQIVMRDMMDRKHGTIVNVSSIAGVKPSKKHTAYAASKYGVRGLSLSARLELAPYNVRVVCIEPGAVATELIDHTTSQVLIDDYNHWKESIGAVGIQAKDVATTIKFTYELPQCVNLREIVITDTKQDS